MVELRGRLSNPEVRDLVASVGQLAAGINSDHSHASSAGRALRHQPG